MLSGCSVDAKWMLSSCLVDAEWVLSGCSVDANWCQMEGLDENYKQLR